MLTTHLAAAMRTSNPSRGTWITLGALAALGIGGVVFFSTRRAAATNAAQKGFTVSDDCMTITVVNETEVRNAATAAGLIVHPLPSDPALPAALAMLQLLIPQCDWSPPPPDRTFVHGSSRYTIEQIEDMVGDRTIAELTELVSQGAGPSFASSPPLPKLLGWVLNPAPVVVIDPPLMTLRRPRRSF